MKRIIIGVTIVVLCLLTISAAPQSNQSKTWEYKFEYKMNEKKANELGAQGWELTAIESTGPGLGGNVPVYVFKRPH